MGKQQNFLLCTFQIQSENVHEKKLQHTVFNGDS